MPSFYFFVGKGPHTLNVQCIDKYGISVYLDSKYITCIQEKNVGVRTDIPIQCTDILWKINKFKNND